MYNADTITSLCFADAEVRRALSGMLRIGTSGGIRGSGSADEGGAEQGEEQETHYRR